MKKTTCSSHDIDYNDGEDCPQCRYEEYEDKIRKLKADNADLLGALKECLKHLNTCLESDSNDLYITIRNLIEAKEK